MTAEPPILVEHVDMVSTITFNRPAQLNAFDPDTVEEFQSVVRRVDLEPSTRAIVLTGAGRAFTAGGDIRTFGAKHDPRVNRRGWHLVHRMLEIEKPIVAMVNGPAIGLGLTIALLCDSVVMADDATIGDPHVNLGLVAGDGAAVVLPVLIGPHRAKELLLTGRLITGTEAAAMGMINRAVPAGELSDAAYALAREFAAQPTYAARATKMAVNRYLRWMVEQTLDVSLAYEAISRELPEYPEAVEAWRQRRARRADEPRP
ncbi:MAG TPA: enoyl-CoA hydratase/isomerase family protein [Acidimicrobiales bacterium]|nr:enoyl-CoA hydratase/isomerase family protein [Acidimicrobiales bacterium]